MDFPNRFSLTAFLMDDCISQLSACLPALMYIFVNIWFQLWETLGLE
jgi:hypothetical protein